MCSKWKFQKKAWHNDNHWFINRFYELLLTLSSVLWQIHKKLVLLKMLKSKNRRIKWLWGLSHKYRKMLTAVSGPLDASPATSRCVCAFVGMQAFVGRQQSGIPQRVMLTVNTDPNFIFVSAFLQHVASAHIGIGTSHWFGLKRYYLDKGWKVTKWNYHSVHAYLGISPTEHYRAYFRGNMFSLNYRFGDQ